MYTNIEFTSYRHDVIILLCTLSGHEMKGT